jgi:hypothetical protein
MLPSSFNIFAECWFGTVNLSGAKESASKGNNGKANASATLTK